MTPGTRTVQWIQLAGWSLLLGLYLAVSAPQLWSSLQFEWHGRASASYSSDAYLETVTRTRKASARILQALDTVPADKTIVLVLPDSGVRSAFIAQNMTYLSWPREVHWISAEKGDLEDQIFALAPATVGAVLFWDVAPAANWPGGLRLGPGQVIFPLQPAT
ncbi:MAG: hypothetical protein ACR2MW_11465 [Chthoniobacterales bacterium]